MKWHQDRGLHPVDDMKDFEAPGAKWRHWFRNVDFKKAKNVWKGSKDCKKKWRKNMNLRLKKNFLSNGRDLWSPERKRKHSDSNQRNAAEIKKQALERHRDRIRKKHAYWKKKVSESMPENDEDKRETILNVLDDFIPEAKLRLMAMENIMAVLTFCLYCNQDFQMF